MNIGDKLNRLVVNSRSELFTQGELTQLTWGAFNIAVTNLQESQEAEITISYPLGLRPDRQPIQGSWTYKKEELVEKYKFLAIHQLAVNGLFQLVAITEALLGDIVRALLCRYPQKLGGKRNVPIHFILESSSLEEIHLRAADHVLNELSYKSPIEFAEALENLLSLNLLECPAYHKYMEVKASRDIFVHNRGIANDIYTRKAATHARCKGGESLPADPQYFLESYESCIQLTEWLENELHARWHSATLEAKRAARREAKDGSPGA